MSGKSAIYFASDFHLGSALLPDSGMREKRIVCWLNSIKNDASEVFLLGDIFDYWFEYKEVIPKGFIRLQGKLAELADHGIQIHFFTGNHDLWVREYFTAEFGAKIYYQPTVIQKFDKNLFIGHGDGLGPGDTKYKIIKSILTNRICQAAFSLIHPDFGIRLMKYASHSSRMNNEEEKVSDINKERQIIFCENHILSHPGIDYYIFGHRHIPMQYVLKNGKSTYINLGEWWNHCSYVRMKDDKVELLDWQ
jgi:UDP-2,3-diacylglucosamine hydrolase